MTKKSGVFLNNGSQRPIPVKEKAKKSIQFRSQSRFASGYQSRMRDTMKFSSSWLKMIKIYLAFIYIPAFRTAMIYRLLNFYDLRTIN